MSPLEARSGGRRPRRRALFFLLALAFTTVQVRQSLDGGRLALPPTYDDVGYMLDAQSRLRLLFDQGPAAAAVRALESPPHSPWSTALAAVAFLAFGPFDWAPAAANGVIVLAVLLWLEARSRRLPTRWALAGGAVLLTWPFLGHAVESFRPDIAWGLATAWTVFAVSRRSWLRQRPKAHIFAGAGFGLALLIKPTISPLTVAVVTVALAVSTLAGHRRVPRPRGRRIALAWMRVLGVGALLAAPYYAVAHRWLAFYIHVNTFGARRKIWHSELDPLDHLRYYLTGEGGRVLVDGWLWLWLALAVAALVAAILRRDRRVTYRAVVVSTAFAFSYAVLTAAAHKNAFFGSVLYGLLLLAALEMIVYLASSRAGRAVIAVLLLAGVGLYRWPSALANGDRPVPAHVVEGHHALLEAVYQDLRPAPGVRTWIFFTRTSPYLNPALLQYRLGKDRVGGVTCSDLQPTADVAAHLTELERADYIVALSDDSPEVLRWLPGAGVQEQLLARLRADPEVELAGVYPTPGGGRALLYARARGFRGVTAGQGLGPLEGPYPQWDLPRVRWALGPAARFVIEVPSSGRLRLALDGQTGFPDQVLEVVAAGEVVGRHAFASTGRFERFDVRLELPPGRHEIELVPARWHRPSGAEDRPLAVLLRTLAAVPVSGASPAQR